MIRDAKGDNIGSSKEIRGNESGVPAEMEFRIFRFRSARSHLRARKDESNNRYNGFLMEYCYCLYDVLTRFFGYRIVTSFLEEDLIYCLNTSCDITLGNW